MLMTEPIVRPPPRSASDQPKRFRIFTLGLPKTGTTSLATIFENYRSGHEFMFGLTSQAILNWILRNSRNR